MTYDLIEGHLPPPGLTVLSCTEPCPAPTLHTVDELLSQTPELGEAVAAQEDTTFDTGPG